MIAHMGYAYTVSSLSERDAPTALAHALLEQFAPNELARLTIMVPTLAAAPDIKRALGAAAARRGIAALAAPRVSTLNNWLLESTDASKIESHLARQLRLASLLKKRMAHGERTAWQLAGHVLTACDDLSQTLLDGNGLPETTVEALIREVRRAYRGRAQAVADQEAALIASVWQALASGSRDGPLDPGLAETLALARAGERLVHGEAGAAGATRGAGAADDDGGGNEATAPLILVHPLTREQFDRRTEAFTRAWLKHAPVLHFVNESSSAASQLARRAWDEDALSIAFSTASAVNHKSATTPISAATTAEISEPAQPLTDSLHFLSAGGLEDEAWATVRQVHTWRNAGHERIALIAPDRLTARRARALLERDGLLVADETGWALSTTSAAAVVMRWLICARGGFKHRDLTDLLRSPFIFGDWDEPARKRVSHEIDLAIRRDNVLASLEAVSAALGNAHSLESADAITRLRRAVGQLNLTDVARRVAAWNERLYASLETLGLIVGLRQDAAGKQVLDVLSSMTEEATGAGEVRINFEEWLEIIEASFERARFADDAVESPLVFTTLEASAARRFDCAIIIGADARRLPGTSDEKLFLNQTLRAALRLPHEADKHARFDADLLRLLSQCAEVAVTWQGDADPPATLAPRLAQIELTHRRDFGTSLIGPVRRPLPQVDAQHSHNHRAHAPRAAALVPASVSPSGYATLIACPYRFYAQRMLRLDEALAVSEETDKGDYGIWVHRILQAFHQQHLRVSEHDDAALSAALNALAVREFAPRVARDVRVLQWQAAFEKAIPAYLAWQRSWEARGWTFAESEAARQRVFELPDGSTIKVAGRLDRIDRNASDEFAVLDYKTRKPAALVAALKTPGEDVQLSLYSLISGSVHVAAAAYVSVHETLKQESAASSPDELAQAEEARLVGIFTALRSGAPLPAHGTPAVCQHCEMSGLCRRDVRLKRDDEDESEP
jgi:ATP-dependent helicase/nuclease subunit B